MDEETARDLMFHKGQKVHSYPQKFKSRAIEYAEIHGNKAAARTFGVDRKRIREWRANKEGIISTAGKVKGAQWRQVSGGGRSTLVKNLNNPCWNEFMIS